MFFFFLRDDLTQHLDTWFENISDITVRMFSDESNSEISRFRVKQIVLSGVGGLIQSAGGLDTSRRLTSTEQEDNLSADGPWLSSENQLFPSFPACWSTPPTVLCQNTTTWVNSLISLHPSTYTWTFIPPPRTDAHWFCFAEFCSLCVHTNSN